MKVLLQIALLFTVMIGANLSAKSPQPVKRVQNGSCVATYDNRYHEAIWVLSHDNQVEVVESDLQKPPYSKDSKTYVSFITPDKPNPVFTGSAEALYFLVFTQEDNSAVTTTMMIVKPFGGAAKVIYTTGGEISYTDQNGNAQTGKILSIDSLYSSGKDTTVFMVATLATNVAPFKTTTLLLALETETAPKVVLNLGTLPSPPSRSFASGENVHER